MNVEPLCSLTYSSKSTISAMVVSNRSWSPASSAAWSQFLSFLPHCGHLHPALRDEFRSESGPLLQRWQISFSFQLLPWGPLIPPRPDGMKSFTGQALVPSSGAPPSLKRLSIEKGVESTVNDPLYRCHPATGCHSTVAKNAHFFSNFSRACCYHTLTNQEHLQLVRLMSSFWFWFEEAKWWPDSTNC